MKLRIAFLPLTDAAPLVVAREKGFFAEQGLDVELLRQASWASVRDMLQMGRIDAAQMLATMPLALSAGVSHDRIEVVTGLVLSLNGNAITVSQNLFSDMLRIDPVAAASPMASAGVLRRLIEQRRALGKPRLCFASVFHTSTHEYLLRHFLSGAGIDPDRDVRLVVIPPPRMVESLASGLIDGGCVGEPWNQRAVAEGVGRVLVTGAEIWKHAPEKVLGMRRDWLEDNDDVARRLLAALLAAGEWAEQAGHRREVARLLSAPEYLDLPEELLAWSLSGRLLAGPGEATRAVPSFHVFGANGANYPWPEHAEWYLRQMQRWGHLPGGTDIEQMAAAVYRSDIYEQAAGSMSLGLPEQAAETPSLQRG